ncbi:MAG: hypothetical protein HFH87_11110 [Lachnospiraceae bacterium]|nr:hypothetical protein [Lachnospiraceae bacterium]
MTINALKKTLLELNQMIAPILQESGYLDTADLLSVKRNTVNPDDNSLYDEFFGLLTHLGYVYSVLSYIEKPVTHEGIIQLSRGEKYELDGVELVDEDVIEILEMDHYIKMNRWVTTTVRNNQDLPGRMARIRK